MQRLARVSMHNAAGGAPLSGDGGVDGGREPKGSGSARAALSSALEARG